MNFAVISFTINGGKLNKKLNTLLTENGFSAESFIIKKYSEATGIKSAGKLPEWTERMFKEKDAVIFIGACGIAVRLAAPYIKSKDKDPAVIVIDEKGKFVIPVLSGHIGRANEIAEFIAEKLKAQAVITTATDINNKFSIDNFAVKRNMHISDIKKIKEVSSRILNEENVGFLSDFPIKGLLPQNIVLNRGDDEFECGICISLIEKEPFKITMNLIPKIVSAGIGCRKNADFKNIEALFLKTLKEENISVHSIKSIASIDLKKHESGLIKLSEKYETEFKTFSADELKSVKGNFIKSEFVKSVTGVDNVCERAALAACTNGKLIVRKKIASGVTIALAAEEWAVEF